MKRTRSKRGAAQTLFVGGTPLYLKGLLRGIFEGPPARWELRHQLQEQARINPTLLHRRLAEIDPAAAQRLHANDTRRLIRAIEVFETLGRPISEFQRQFEAGRPADACRVFVLDWPRTELYDRIDRRVDTMFAAGFVDEVGSLAVRSQSLSRTARQALGYREVLEHLAGKRGLTETIDLVKTHTRQFAKRQLTWFRSLSECRFMPVCGEIDPVEIAEKITQVGMDRTG